MPKVWENILSNLSGSEVANCFRVSWDLRAAIGQCLGTKSRFRQRLDIAATRSAIRDSKILSRKLVRFSACKNNHNCILDRLCAIDNVWLNYSRKNKQTYVCQQDLLGNTNDNGAIEYSFPQNESDSLHFLPTLDFSRLMYVTDCKMTSVEFGDKSAKTQIVHECPSNELYFAALNEYYLYYPYCATYRLYSEPVEKSLGMIRINMCLLEPDGKLSSIVKLYEIECQRGENTGRAI